MNLYLTYNPSFEFRHKVFDPLNLGTLSETIKGQSHGGLFPHAQWLREAEIKHGRMAMLAFVGTVAAVSGLSFPEV